jgi:hypothetical protein
MKKYILLITIVALGIKQANAQGPPDSVLKKYHAGNWKEKRNVIGFYLKYFDKNDSLFAKKSLEVIAYFKKQNDDAGVDYAQVFLAYRAFEKNDYATALDIALPVLSSYKTRNDTSGILWTTGLISIAYEATKNYTEGIKYMKERIPFNLALGDKRSLSQTYNWIGSNYAEAFMPDSGLIYAQQSLYIDYALKDDDHLLVSLSTVAENYIAKGEYDLALPFLRKSMNGKNTIKRGYRSLAVGGQYSWLNNDFAQAYLGMKQYDSAIYYANRSLFLSIPEDNISHQLRAYEYLYKSFDAMQRQDSSNKYFRLAATIKDSLFSMEKVKAVEAASFNALLRQQELDAEKKISEEQRKQNLQFVLIAISIVSFIMLFFLLSRTIIVNEKFISFLAILGLLIVFEFINLLIHPLLEKKTNHSPALMLVVLVIVASFLIPLHHRMEKWIKEKMIEKNNRIRLAAAKKTIEKLEGRPIQTKEEKE